MEKLPISAVVITRDEELNICHCIQGLCAVFDEVWVVDSGSTDRTVEIAKAEGANVVIHAWPGYPQQWNYAINELPTRNELICIFAADERPTEEWSESVRTAIREHPDVDLIFTKSKFVWLGRWIRHGGYFERYSVRIGRKGNFRFDERAVGEHPVVSGQVLYLDSAYLHADEKPLGDWVRKHVRYAELEAQEQLAERANRAINPPRLLGTTDERIRWLRQNVYLKLPRFVRPGLYLRIATLSSRVSETVWKALPTTFCRASGCSFS